MRNRIYKKIVAWIGVFIMVCSLLLWHVDCVYAAGKTSLSSGITTYASNEEDDGDEDEDGDEEDGDEEDGDEEDGDEEDGDEEDGDEEDGDEEDGDEEEYVIHVKRR